MPKRTDIQSILIIGAGPIVIGQGCEFDYAGAQACKALKEEGYRIILVNSNPATIMTDPQMADATYIEPIRWEIVAKIIEKERPDALLPTMGGQTALNCALDLVRYDILSQFGVQLIGATKEAIDKAEDRALFREAMEELGLKMPQSAVAHTLDEAKILQKKVGFPTVVRPSFTLGGSGGGIAYHIEEFEEICKRGLEISPTHELLIEQSILGWKEYEMEVVRDKHDNCIIVCAIENLDPMGVHTGDSITVAPAQTLTDKEYQGMRNAALAVLRKIGVETGGANVQFAVNPTNGELHVIEMNPRVSRSSALASKATGFPIAKVAAKLAVGYTLDELKNEITGDQMPASFEPVLDYVVVKIPRFNFEKFPQADPLLTTQMKSVGEVMAMGTTFQMAFQKAIRGLELGYYGLESFIDLNRTDATAQVRSKLQRPAWQRIWYIADAFRLGIALEEIHALTAVDPWFLAEIEDLVHTENQLKEIPFEKIQTPYLRELKQKGFSDHRLAQLWEVEEYVVRERRHAEGIRPVYKRIDSCAAEFSVNTAYLYSTYAQECEAAVSDNPKKILILGGGPNRIGQGIEFDYCCVHAAQAMQEEGFETIMVNCNPETVSTDYDISNKLYFESLTLEDVLEIAHIEKPLGVVVQFGGQTPLKLAKKLEAAGLFIIGTSPDAIDRAEDRRRFQEMIEKLQLRQPPNGIAHSESQALELAAKIGYPLIVRPSYVLGGRAMEIVYNETELSDYMQRSPYGAKQELLLDRFLDDAIEVDVDAVCDGEQFLLGGILEHIEEAGVHSGDSACSLPPFTLDEATQIKLSQDMEKMAKELNVIGLLNAQFAIKNKEIYVLEVNPRAARTIPFVSKVIGHSLTKIAARCMVGKSLAAQGELAWRVPEFFAVKKSVFPFEKFPGTDPILGPEMRSTGEVMGCGQHFASAYAKSELATGAPLIRANGYALISVKDKDKPAVLALARSLQAAGFALLATKGTAQALMQAGLLCEVINKVNEGRPHIVDIIKNDKIAFIINTTEGRQAMADSEVIRRTAVQHKVCYTTTLSGAEAQIKALAYRKECSIACLQELHMRVKEKCKDIQ